MFKTQTNATHKMALINNNTRLKKNSGAPRRTLCPKIQNSVGAYEERTRLEDRRHKKDVREKNEML